MNGVFRMVMLSIHRAVMKVVTFIAEECSVTMDAAAVLMHKFQYREAEQVIAIN